MGESKRRAQSIGKCIYCGSIEKLSREHVIPFGLGGDLVLRDASCHLCSTETGKLELRLLRGHWWPYRLYLGMPSRRSNEVVPDLLVKIKRSDATFFDAYLPMNQQSVAMVLEFDPPSILTGVIKNDPPGAPRAALKFLSALPKRVQNDGAEYQLDPKDQIEIPINYSVTDLCRFLAKVAHGYAISRRGLDACSEFFLVPLILGKTDGANTYVGGKSSQFIGSRLPGTATHALMDRVNAGFLTVYIQLFRDSGDPPPIYEVVVGRV
jgi:hypothetical protein